MTVADALPPHHASCVAIAHGEAWRGLLIEGPSGAGKSDLALRLIDRGARLVSDDYVMLRSIAGRLIASPPPRIAGMIEVRGIGIVAWPHIAEAEVGLVIALDDAVERMPVEGRSRTLLGTAIPLVSLPAYDASAAIKAEIAMAQLWQGGR